MCVRQCERASVVAGKGKVVELSELEGCVVWCVVTIDVHPELRGRVGKVDGDVVVSAAGGGRRDRCFRRGTSVPPRPRVMR